MVLCKPQNPQQHIKLGLEEVTLWARKMVSVTEV